MTESLSENVSTREAIASKKLNIFRSVAGAILCHVKKNRKLTDVGRCKGAEKHSSNIFLSGFLQKVSDGDGTPPWWCDYAEILAPGVMRVVSL